MIPVIMLTINIRALSSLPIPDLLCLTRPPSDRSQSFAFLRLQRAPTWSFWRNTGGGTIIHLIDITYDVQLAILALLSNIFATSIIAVKTWYVSSR